VNLALWNCTGRFQLNKVDESRGDSLKKSIFVY
jgi:hypothetical protein